MTAAFFPVTVSNATGRPFGQQLCIIGDSIASDGGTLSIRDGEGRTRPAYAFTTWLTASLGERVNLDPAFNLGAGGETTAYFLSIVPKALSLGAQWIITQGPTNGVQYEKDAAVAIANLRAAYDQILAAGRRLIIVLPFPRSAFALARLGIDLRFAKGYYASIARFQRRYAQLNPGVIVFDPRSAGIADPATGDYLEGMSADGTHLSAFGAKLVGAAMGEALAPFLSADAGPLQTDPNDLFDPLFNQTGNQIANPLFAKPSGGLFLTASSVVAGVAPADWTIQFVANAPAALYRGRASVGVVARGDSAPGRWLATKISALEGGSNHDYFYYSHGLQFAYLGTPNGTLNVGDQIEALIEYRITNTRGIRSFGLTSWTVDGGGFGIGHSVMGASDGAEASGGGNHLWPTGLYAGVLRLPPVEIMPAKGDGTRYITFQARVELDTTVPGGAEAEILFARPSLRKVPYCGGEFPLSFPWPRNRLRARPMPQFKTTRRVAHSATRMFDLVADVEAYPAFLPLCTALRVRKRTPTDNGEILVADMEIGYKAIRERFTSRVTCDPSTKTILVEYIDGPFRRLVNRWHFNDIPMPDGGAPQERSNVEFFIDYEFKSRTLGLLMGAVFDRAFRQFADAFEARADKIYGRAPRV